MEPSLRPLVPSLIDDLFAKATRLAEKEMGRPSVVDELSWKEIFEDDYDFAGGVTWPSWKRRCARWRMTMRFGYP